MNRKKDKLLKKIKNKAYRDAFVSELIDTGIPFQIRALRGDLTQKEFSKKLGMFQERISVLEDSNYAKFTLTTLKKIASKLDIGLVVRFVPISDLVKWELALSKDSLKVPSYEEDTYFKENEVDMTSSGEEFKFKPQTTQAAPSNVIQLYDVQPSKATDYSANFQATGSDNSTSYIP